MSDGIDWPKTNQISRNSLILKLFLPEIGEEKTMKKLAKMMFFVAMILCNSSAFAQIVFGNGPGQCQLAPQVQFEPQRCRDGRYITQPVQPVYAGYSQYNGYQVGIPQGIGIGQQFSAMVGGQQMRCTLKDRAATGVVGGLLAAAAGYAVDRHRGNTGHRYTEIGAVVGAVAGATLFCQPDIVDDTPAPQMVYQPQPTYQQAAYRPSQPIYNPGQCRMNDTGEVRSGLTQEECDRFAREHSTTKTVSITEKVSANNTEAKSETVSKPNAAFWGWINPTSSPSNKKPCYASKQINGMPPECSEIRVEAPVADEIESVWRNRVAQLGMPR